MSKPFRIIGILNYTPDSFSDGGVFFSPEKAREQCLRLQDEGADLIDIGAESTRPGAKPLTPEEEWIRLEPLLEALFKVLPASILSLDSRHDATALKGANFGVKMINNVNGLYKTETLAELATFSDLEYCAMHMKDNPKTMQDNPLSDEDAVDAVASCLTNAVEVLGEAGFSKERIFVDPGIGFGKTDPANFALIAKCREWSSEWNLYYGVSRKSFIGRKFHIEAPEKRDPQSKQIELELIRAGAKVIRTHNVKALLELIHSS